ncbi:MAG: hypothetical protein JST00_41770 [Deltaproteobacteria bacterium]|nr:hypothetical protein [Deltaproteobacteria bacterium]
MKVLAVSTTVLACVTVAGVSSADDTPAPTTTGTNTTPTPTAPPAVPDTTDVTSSTTITQAEVAPPPPAPAPLRDSETTTVYKNKRPNTALLVTGAALFASTYVTTAAIHAGNGREGGVDDHLYIPIAGPWINLGQSSHETRDDVLIVGSGILQGVGAGLFISSFFVPSKVEAARINAGPVKMNLTPTTYAGGAGFGAVGTF